jgi:integrase
VPRPQLSPGTIGKVSLRKRGSSWQARAKARTYGGRLLELNASGPSPEEAIAALERDFREIAVFAGGQLSEKSTISEAIDAWLAGRHAAVAAGALKPQSVERYERTAKAVKAKLGALRLHEARPAILLPILEDITIKEGAARARNFSVILNGAFSTAVAREAMPRNPLSSSPRYYGTKQIESWLSPAQFNSMRKSVREWGERPRTRGDWERLLGLIDTAMGTSMRIGEVLALRPIDLRLAASPPSVELTGTIVEVGGRLVRQNIPKRHGQERILPLPPPVAATLQVLADRAPNPTALLFGTRTGEPDGNPERLLKTWRTSADGQQWVQSVGIPTKEVTFKLMRRSAGNRVRKKRGLAAAQALLGHRYESTTEESYTEVPVVDAETAETLAEMWE